MGSLFSPKEPSTQDDDRDSDDDESIPIHDAPETDTTPEMKIVVEDDESPF